MGSDSIVNVSVLLFSKDSSKKKRTTNRLAKLKQCKLDARREQWLSQAKNKGCKEEMNGSVGSSPSSLPRTDERNLSLSNFETRSRGGEENEGSSFHDSDLESLANSPTSSILVGNDLIRKNRPGSSSGSSSSSSSGCCFGNISGEEEEEDDDDNGLDDWEAVADALTADEKGHQTASECPVEPQNPIGSDNLLALPNRACEGEISKPESKGTTPKPAASARAWKADDVFRPQSLPNILKQRSFSISSEQHRCRGAGAWACHGMISQPSSCPICYEDLDVTDSCFLPCSCGFRLCLFCHKRILEADGRCPGCRKQYDPVHCEKGFYGGARTVRLSRCCSMNARS